MKDLDIAALMCSKICHDLISPVGALANGIEVLAEDDDADMREHAIALIDASARQASAKLQFARLAFGAAGSASDMIELGQAESVARGFFEAGKIKLDWQAPPIALPKPMVRLLLNMLVLAADCIPRGGSLTIESETRAGKTDMVITAAGPKAALPEHARFLDQDETPDPDSLDARAIQPFVTSLLAKRLNVPVTHDADEEQVMFRVALPKEAAAA